MVEKYGESLGKPCLGWLSNKLGLINKQNAFQNPTLSYIINTTPEQRKSRARDQAYFGGGIAIDQLI
jgi:hypothetical protein